MPSADIAMDGVNAENAGAFFCLLLGGQPNVLFLAFGSANTWQEDFHLSSFVPCPAHTLHFTSGASFCAI